MMRPCLTVDSTNQWISIGIFDTENEVMNSIYAGRDASAFLVPMIRELFEKSSLKKPDWICCARGPGSFTSTRIGVGVARNLAQMWNIPVMGIDSLYFYGKDCLKKTEAERAAVMIDAKQQKVCARLVSRDTEDMQPETATLDIAPGEFLKSLEEDIPIFADETEVILKIIEKSYGPTNRTLQKIDPPSARSLYELAEELGGIQKAGEWQSLLPVYTRKDPATTKFPEGINPN